VVYPCQTNTVWFKRKLDDADRKIILAAGSGNLTDGWHHLLETYQKLWELGYRPRKDLYDFLGADMQTTEKPVVGGSDAF